MIVFQVSQGAPKPQTTPASFNHDSVFTAAFYGQLLHTRGLTLSSAGTSFDFILRSIFSTAHLVVPPSAFVVSWPHASLTNTGPAPAAPAKRRAANNGIIVHSELHHPWHPGGSCLSRPTPLHTPHLVLRRRFNNVFPFNNTEMRLRGDAHMHSTRATIFFNSSGLSQVFCS